MSRHSNSAEIAVTVSLSVLFHIINFVGGAINSVLFAFVALNIAGRCDLEIPFTVIQVAGFAYALHVLFFTTLARYHSYFIDLKGKPEGEWYEKFQKSATDAFGRTLAYFIAAFLVWGLSYPTVFLIKKFALFFS